MVGVDEVRTGEVDIIFVVRTDVVVDVEGDLTGVDAVVDVAQDAKSMDVTIKQVSTIQIIPFFI